MAQLSDLLNASSIAIVGASDRPSKVGYRPLRYLLEYGYEGRIFPINPTRDTCQGLTCYAFLADLPIVPELVAIIVSAERVPSVLREAAKLGTRSAVVISAGFGETGERGRDLETELRQIANDNGMQVIGPNSVGVIHAPNKLTVTFTEALIRGPVIDGSIGVVSQSGAFGTVIYAEARDRGLGIRTYVSSGNEAHLTYSDYLAEMVEDEQITVIGGYLEGLREGKRFMRAAQRARDLDKPIVLLKVGNSDDGRRAAQSHTGALSGSAIGYEAAFDRLGVVQVRDEVELLDTIEAFNTLRVRPARTRVAIVTMSGGSAVLTSDLLDREGVSLAVLSAETVDAIKALLPPFATTVNPIDVTGQFVTDAGALGDVLSAIAEDPDVDVIIAFSGLGWSGGESGWIAGMSAFHHPTVPIIAVVPLCSTEDRLTLRAAGVPAYRSARQAVQVLGALQRWGRWVRPPEGATERASTLLPTGTLGEDETKRLLSEVGIRIPEYGIAKSPDEARRIATSIGGLLVLKLEVPELTHKTEVGGVRVEVLPEDASAVYESLAEIAGRIGANSVNVPVRVESFVKSVAECAVGIVTAAPFGHLVMVGFGGTQLELTQDVTFRLAPVTVDEAREMITSLKGAALLDGWRGGPAGDGEALAEIVAQVSRFSVNMGDRLVELDINPVAVLERGKGAVALDALMVLSE